MVRLENSNHIWKRETMGLPSGQMSFLLRAGTNTLSTSLNLRWWRLRDDSSCPLCGQTGPTIHHILSNCPEALQQGGYTWQHDSVLKTLIKSIKNTWMTITDLYADLPSMRTSENPVVTIPEDILVTSTRPDIVLVGVEEVALVELTIPHTCNSMESLYNTRDCKSQRNLSAICWWLWSKGSCHPFVHYRDWLTGTLAPRFPEGPDESSSITNKTNNEEDYRRGST